MARDDEDVDVSDDPSDSIGQAAKTLDAEETAGDRINSKTNRAADSDEGDRESQQPTGRKPVSGASGDGEEEAPAGQSTEKPQPPEQPEWHSIRDVAKQRAGYDPALWKDDEHAASEIVDGYRKFREIEPDYTLYQRLSPQFQAWLQNQGQPAPQQAQPEQPKWYKPPEFQEAWIQDLELDEKGNVRPKEGRQVSPDRLNKVTNYLQWIRETRSRFERDPQSAINEMVTDRVQEIVESKVNERVETLRLQQQAQSFADKHAQWLFRHDGGGNRVFDPHTNKPVLTDEGRMFAHYFSQGESRGLKTMDDLTDYALAMTERHLLRNRYSGDETEGEKKKAPAKQPTTDVTDALKRAGKSPKRSASTANPNEIDRQAQNPKADLASQLRAAFKENGITDKDLD